MGTCKSLAMMGINWMMEYLALPIEKAPRAKMRHIFHAVLVWLKGKTMPLSMCVALING